MFGAISDWIDPTLLKVVTIWLTGFVIKLMDDYLDQEYDAETGYHSLAQRLGKAALPYTLLTFAFGCLLMPSIAVSYFFAAYAVGMVGEMPRLLPSRLSGFQETAIVSIVGVFTIGWHQFVLSLLIVLAIQAVDDLLDYTHACDRGGRNWVVRWGKQPVQVFATTSSLVAFWLDPLQTLAAFLGAWIVVRMMSSLAGKGVDTLPEGGGEGGMD